MGIRGPQHLKGMYINSSKMDNDFRSHVSWKVSANHLFSFYQFYSSFLCYHVWKNNLWSPPLSLLQLEVDFPSSLLPTLAYVRFVWSFLILVIM